MPPAQPEASATPDDIRQKLENMSAFDLMEVAFSWGLYNHPFFLKGSPTRRKNLINKLVEIDNISRSHPSTAHGAGQGSGVLGR